MLAAPGRTERVDGESTLDQLLYGVWEGLTADRPVACPVCTGRLVPRYAAHARPVGGRCEDCGSSLG